VRWDGRNWEEIQRFAGKAVLFLANPHGTIEVTTDSGVMRAPIGHWIAKGTQGEFYPIMPAVFEAKYIQVRDDMPLGNASERIRPGGPIEIPHPDDETENA
jgi:hypothetical protein